MKNFSELKEQYKAELLNSVIPFWEKYSIDKEHGGFLTCLTREGKIFDTDKFVWLQGRESWMFSTFFLEIEKKEEWRQIGKHGVDFLENYCHKDGNYYFSLTREGSPLIEPYNIFSDCFACMAYTAYSKTSNDDKYKELAAKTFNNIIRKQNAPKGKWEKSTGNRTIINFALPMILCNLSLELEGVLDKSIIDKTIGDCTNSVMNVFRDKSTGLIFENVKPNGDRLDTFEGRLINPGHGIEAMWFILDIAERSNNRQLIDDAVSSILSIIEYGWDDKYGGIFYFMDSKGYPPQQLEWDQKLWWVHIEALIALLKGYRMTGNEKLWKWFEIIHKYVWSHYPDTENGEWIGYLNRQGDPLLDLKGGKWKGCFHLPRGLLKCWQELELLEKKS